MCVHCKTRFHRARFPEQAEHTKDGRGPLAILEKQVFRQHLAFPDVASGTNDGGGENISKDGMHAILESLGQRYVKRRGLEHISWRVCDA